MSDVNNASRVAQTSEQTKQSNRRWLWRLLWLLLALYILEQDAEGILWSGPLQTSAGTLAAKFVPTPGFAPGYVQVSDITPDSPMRQAGVTNGDQIAFDRRFDFVRRLRTGEQVKFSLERDGRMSRHTVAATAMTADPGSQAHSIGILVAGITGVIITLVGIFFLWVGRGTPSVTWLGILQITVGMLNIEPGLWTSNPNNFAVLATINLSLIALAPVASFAFAMRFYEENLGSVGPGVGRIWPIYIALVALTTAMYDYSWLGFTSERETTFISILWSISNYIGFLLTLMMIYLGWKRSISEINRRFSFLLVGFLMFVFAQAIYVTLSGVLQDSNWESSPLIYLANFLIAIAAPALFAYAILKHKVIDLGFAINRTLVYGIISFGLLLVFGLIEWVSERILPEESFEATAVVNAGVALTIFVVFHRVRDFVQHHVERLLFRAWHANEAALRRFLRHAAFVSKPDALAAAAVAEWCRFSSGARCALYLRDGDDYARMTGDLAGAPDRIDRDEKAVVIMRAEHGLIELHESGSSLAAALALPFVHRAELHGFVLLASKPSGDSYRPDEIELLGMAAHQIGLDLHALKVEQLESRVLDLEARNGELRAAISNAAISPSLSIGG